MLTALPVQSRRWTGVSKVRVTVFGLRTFGGLGHSQLVFPCEVARGDPYGLWSNRLFTYT